MHLSRFFASAAVVASVVLAPAAHAETPVVKTTTTWQQVKAADGGVLVATHATGTTKLGTLTVKCGAKSGFKCTVASDKMGVIPAASVRTTFENKSIGPAWKVDITLNLGGDEVGFQVRHTDWV